MIRKVLLILLLSIPSALLAQKNTMYNYERKEENTQSTLKAQVMANTVIVKLKPEHRNFFNSLSFVKSLQKALKGVTIKNVESMFPRSVPPANSLEYSNSVDLTLIYKINYTGIISVDVLAAELEKTGYFEYAEAQIVETLLYTPNDTLSVPDDNNYEGKASQNHLLKIKAFEAWDIEQGDTNVIIGVIDTGTDFNNPDFSDNIKYNYADPINGTDDDGDGYVDNFTGYDLADNDNNPQHTPNQDHGLMVSGCSSAATDNVAGIAGTGFKCKYMPIKGSKNADSLSNPPIVAGYQGIVYAAEHGCKVIVCSWGSPNSYSKLNQDIINYAALTHDAVIVAAAGNTHGEFDFYPASYDNVISVAATMDSNDLKWPSSSYSKHVDLSVQGKRIFTIGQGNTYKYVSGTSFSAPLVAGAAGLVRSRYPHLNALQVAELLRVTTDNIDTIPGNAPYIERLGKGRLNMYKALSDSTTPSIRMVKSSFINNENSSYVFSGDTVKVYCDFLNYLNPTQNLDIVLTGTSSLITMLDSTTHIGVINTLEKKINSDDPFTFYINPTSGQDLVLTFRLGYSDPAINYTDYQYFTYLINPSYINIDTNKVLLSITSNGRLGFAGDFIKGEGAVYKNKLLLYEAGLMLATSKGNDTLVSDCIRNGFFGIDTDLNSVRDIRMVTSDTKDQEVHNYLNDSSSIKPIGVSIFQKSYAWGAAPNDKFVIVEYQITNNRTDTLNKLSVGLFADWDIVTAANQYYNKAKFDTTINLGYAYNTDPNSLYGGIALLTNDAPICYSMDHANTPGNINPLDGFSHLEKFKTLTGGLSKMEAGFSPYAPNVDISQIVGAELKDVLPGETRTVAFAILSGDDFFDLKTNTIAAQNKFKSIKQGPVPVVSSITFCPGDTVDININPSNGTTFKFYDNQYLTNLLYQGNSYPLANITKEDTLFVTNADSLFESSAAVQYINLSTTPTSDFIIAEDTLILGVNSTAYFFNNSTGASGYEWDFGDSTTSTLTHPSHKYTSAGSYSVNLIATDTYGCKDTSSKIIVLEIISGIADGLSNQIITRPNPVMDMMQLTIPAVNEPLTLQLINSLGQVSLDQIHILPGENESWVDLSKLPKGVYMLKLSGISGHTITKIIKN